MTNTMQRKKDEGEQMKARTHTKKLVNYSKGQGYHRVINENAQERVKSAGIKSERR